MKLGEAMYKAQSADAEGASAEQPAQDDVVDAEFEDVTDDDANKKEQA